MSLRTAMILDDTFVRNVDRLEECMGRGDLTCAERVCRSALDASKSSTARVEWLRRHAEVLVVFGCFARGRDMACRAIDEMQCTTDMGGAMQSTVDFARLATFEVGSRVIDPPLATDLAREAVTLANRLLDSPSLDQKLHWEVWVSLANAYGVLGMPEERLRCYLSAAALCPEKDEQALVWLGVADARDETDGFEASYRVIDDHVLPAILEFPKLAPIAFAQIGDLFLNNEEWGSACKAYEAARIGLKDDPIRRQNRPFVADLHFKLSYALMNLGETQDATRAAEKALEVVDADTASYVKHGAYLILGNAKAQGGDHDEALRLYEVVVAAPDATEADRHAALEGISSLDAVGRIQ